MPTTRHPRHHRPTPGETDVPEGESADDTLIAYTLDTSASPGRPLTLLPSELSLELSIYDFPALFLILTTDPNSDEEDEAVTAQRHATAAPPRPASSHFSPQSYHSTSLSTPLTLPTRLPACLYTQAFLEADWRLPRQALPRPAAAKLVGQTPRDPEKFGKGLLPHLRLRQMLPPDAPRSVRSTRNHNQKTHLKAPHKERYRLSAMPTTLTDQSKRVMNGAAHPQYSPHS
ncbi:hypothetical protein O3P69_014563 [Scylla paramamosain]|uniref:Uncharacterized protein n=1 Tax=Scylla paramamosain TaxID=85552 RepID=A0AAW0SCQ9_SCYPA